MIDGCLRLMESCEISYIQKQRSDDAETRQWNRAVEENLKRLVPRTEHSGPRRMLGAPVLGVRQLVEVRIPKPPSEAAA